MRSVLPFFKKLMLFLGLNFSVALFYYYRYTVTCQKKHNTECITLMRFCFYAHGTFLRSTFSQTLFMYIPCFRMHVRQCGYVFVCCVTTNSTTNTFILSNQHTHTQTYRTHIGKQLSQVVHSSTLNWKSGNILVLHFDVSCSAANSRLVLTESKLLVFIVPRTRNLNRPLSWRVLVCRMWLLDGISINNHFQLNIAKNIRKFE